jgi:hypothetical protein
LSAMNELAAALPGKQNAKSKKVKKAIVSR